MLSYHNDDIYTIVTVLIVLEIGVFEIQNFKNYKIQKKQQKQFLRILMRSPKGLFDENLTNNQKKLRLNFGYFAPFFSTFSSFLVVRT